MMMMMIGSICYGLEQPAKKLGARSKKGIFVGYDKESPSYLIYFPDKDKIRKYRCVICTDKLYEECKVDEGDRYVDLGDDDDFVTRRYVNHHNVLTDDNDVQLPVVVEEQNPNESEPGHVLRDDNDVQLPGVAQEQRYPRREHCIPNHLQDYDLSTDQADFVQLYTNIDYCYRASTTYILKTYIEAVECPEFKDWKLTMEDELKALSDNDTFTVMKLPDNKKSICGRWVYTVKDGPDDKDIFKACYVAKGYNQIYGSDYFDTFSPTAKMTSIRVMIQYSAKHELIFHQLDVKTAYLNAPIDCEIYIDQPE